MRSTATGRPWAATSSPSSAMSKSSTKTSQTPMPKKINASRQPRRGASSPAFSIAALSLVNSNTRAATTADIGVDDQRHQISPLHSHETDGVIHIESPDPVATFTLGQFFRDFFQRGCLHHG